MTGVGHYTGLYGNAVFNFQKNCQSGFPSGIFTAYNLSVKSSGFFKCLCYS